MHVLGIDAGGSKTVALLADSEGQVVGEGRGGGANLQTHGELAVEKTFHDVIDQAMGAAGSAPSAVCLGLAGVDRTGEREVIGALMRRLGFRGRTLIVNDALIALTAGAGLGPGLVVIAGTGSIAFGVNGDGAAARAGGWGAVVGDEGSGYWLGRRALMAVVREADGRGPRTGLTPLVLEHFGVASADALVATVYDPAAGPRRVASLGATVERARAAGDAVAADILRDAGAELAQAAATVTSRLGMRGCAFDTVLSGGVLRGVPWLAADVTRRMAEVAPRSTVRTLDVEPAVGAVRLALADLAGRTRLPRYLEGSEADPS